MNETEQTPQILATFPSQAIIPPYHPREEERIARLYGYKILDTEPDPLLDELTKMAANHFKAPIALISLIDKDRQWFKSSYGLNARETCRNIGFCPYAIINDKEPFIIRNAKDDARFKENPFVTGEPYIRFYAGVALPNDAGLPLGTFCVIDTKPRDITAEEIISLESFARIAMECIDLANSRREMSRLLHLEKEVYNRLLLTSAELSNKVSNFNDSLYQIVSNLDPDLGWLSARIRNMQTGGTTGIFYNPIIPPDSKLKDVWGIIDSTTSNSLTGIAHTEFISLNQQQPEYAYIVVPVRNRNQLVAVIELLYPDHRKIDPRIKDVFDLMAVNLSVIAERELITLTLTQQARTDPLTGSANRTVIFEEIEKSLRNIDSTQGHAALFYFDLNKFKEINDTLGHLIGDTLLKEVTQRLRIHCRDGDLIGRLSGDELIMIARRLNTQSDLPQLIQRLEECFTNGFLVQGQHIRLLAELSG